MDKGSCLGSKYLAPSYPISPFPSLLPTSIQMTYSSPPSLYIVVASFDVAHHKPEAGKKHEDAERKNNEVESLCVLKLVDVACNADSSKLHGSLLIRKRRHNRCRYIHSYYSYRSQLRGLVARSASRFPPIIAVKLKDESRCTHSTDSYSLSKVWTNSKITGTAKEHHNEW